MPNQVHTRVGGMTQAVDTLSAVTNLIDGSNAGAIQVPPNVRRLKRMLAALGFSADVTTDAGGVFVVRLSGNGVKDGPHDVVIGSFAIAAKGTAADGLQTQMNPAEIELELDVTPNGLITVQAGYTGVDIGTPQIGVSLVFE